MKTSPELALFLVLAVPALAPAELVVTAGKAEGAAGGEAIVSISLQGVKDTKGVSALELALVFDPAILTIKEVRKGGALAEAMVRKVAGESPPGKVAVGFVCGPKAGGKEMASVEDDGVVMEVVFAVSEKAEQGQKSPVKLDNYHVFRDPGVEMAARLNDGEVTVTAGGASKNLLLWIGIGAGALLLFLLLLFLLFKRRRRDDNRSYARPGYPAAAPAYGSPAGTFPHQCVQCGGVLHLPANMRGQRFQCGACGAAQVAGSGH